MRRAPENAGAPGGRETILLVEDDAALRFAVRYALERCGYTVLEAPNARAALLRITNSSRTFDLLLTDVEMPGMSGRALVERVVALRRGVKFLYMSGYTEDTVVREGVLPRESPYLQKPFSPNTLARKVRAVLDAT